MTNNPTPAHLQRSLSRYDDFLAAEFAKVRDLPENKAVGSGEHSELFYYLLAALSKSKGVSQMQAADTVKDFLSRAAPEIKVLDAFDGGPQDMQRIREKMAGYLVDQQRAAPSRQWWRLWW